MNYFDFPDSQINTVGYTPTYTPTEVRDIEAPVNYVDLTSEIEMPKESDFVMLDIPDQEDFEEPTESLLSRVAFSNKKDYIKTMRPIIKQALVNNGIDESYTDLLVAQTALESGWGKSKLSKLYNNFGGIKGSGALLDTKEFENGTYKKQKSSFKAYSSINEFADDYVPGYQCGQHLRPDWVHLSGSAEPQPYHLQVGRHPQALSYLFGNGCGPSAGNLADCAVCEFRHISPNQRHNGHPRSPADGHPVLPQRRAVKQHLVVPQIFYIFAYQN